MQVIKPTPQMWAKYNELVSAKRQRSIAVGATQSNANSVKPQRIDGWIGVLLLILFLIV